MSGFFVFNPNPHLEPPNALRPTAADNRRRRRWQLRHRRRLDSSRTLDQRHAEPLSYPHPRREVHLHFARCANAVYRPISTVSQSSQMMQKPLQNKAKTFDADPLTWAAGRICETHLCTE